MEYTVNKHRPLSRRKLEKKEGCQEAEREEGDGGETNRVGLMFCLCCFKSLNNFELRPTSSLGKCAQVEPNTQASDLVTPPAFTFLLQPDTVFCVPTLLMPYPPCHSSEHT